MQLPVKAHYATLAMLALAQHYESRHPLPARVIASEHKIPSQFLGQILQQLRAAGLISSTRGASGGFLLERSPREISIAEILDCICSSNSPGTNSATPSNLCAAVNEVWEELGLKQREVLENHSLGDLLQRASAPDPMFYI